MQECSGLYSSKRLLEIVGWWITYVQIEEEKMARDDEWDPAMSMKIKSIDVMWLCFASWKPF